MDELEQRFWSKVCISDGCWEWLAALDGRGYGKLLIGSRSDNSRRYVQAHRISFEIMNGPIPTGAVVCHRCDNKRCVRPSHLFVGSQAENVRDCVQKGRHGSRVKPHRVARGEANANAKLTAEIVRTMRAARLHGMSVALLARAYDVSVPTVRAAISGKTWRHV